MRKTLFLIAALCISLSAYTQDWNWKTVAKDFETGHYQGKLFNSTQSISIIRYKATAYRTDIANDPSIAAATTSDFGKRYNALGSINGSYFDTKALTPATYVKDDGTKEGTLNSNEAYRADGVVAIKGRNKVVVTPVVPDNCEKATARYREVLQSGPILITDGVSRKTWPNDSFFTSRHPRSVLGTTDDGWVYLIVIDGRSSGKADGATIAEAVQLAEILNLTNAINLDGGGSSALWESTGGVISYPCDNYRYDHSGERRVPNAIVVK